MKTMTCQQLGGACDLPLRGETADEVIKAQDKHLKEAVAAGDTDPRAGAERHEGPVEAPGQGDGLVQEHQARVRRRCPRTDRSRTPGRRRTDGHAPEDEAGVRTHADSHDLIRVQGARENNLKDVSVEIPKRRLTVFTGVSGSGKSSLVFDTIAAESQRMINETYSAFVQGFMPNLARPEVDLLEGLTTAIIVDQERMGANPRSTVGTATDANAMLRILFSRLGEPYVGPQTAFSFNVPTRKASGVMSTDKGGRVEKSVVRDAVYLGGMCPRCEGMGNVSDIDLTALYDETKSLSEGALTIPGYSHGRLVRPAVRGRRPADGQADREVHQEAARHDALRRADQDQGRGHQPHLRRDHPQDPEVDAVQGPRGDAAARASVRRAGGDLPDLPGLRRHPADPGGAVVEGQRQEHRRPVRDADQRPGRLGARPRRAVGGPAARRAAAPARLVRRDRPGLPLAGPARGHAVRRRGAAHQDDPAPRLVADRRHLRLRRAHDRPAPARHRADEPPAAAAARQGQHRARRRAQAGDHRHRRPRDRPRPGSGHRGRRGLLRGHAGRAAGERHHHRPAPRRPGQAQGVGARVVGRPRGARRLDAQPAGRRRRHPARRALRADRRRRLRQELAGDRLGRSAGTASSSVDQGAIKRLAAQQPRDVHRAARADPQGVRQGQRRQAGAVQLQLRGRLLHLQRRRRDLHRARA